MRDTICAFKGSPGSGFFGSGKGSGARGLERTGGAGGWFGFGGGGLGVFVGVRRARRGRGEGLCARWGVVPRMLMSLPHAPKRVAWVWFPARVTMHNGITNK